MSLLAKRWPNVCRLHQQAARSSDPLWLRRLRLFRHAAAIGFPDAFAGPVRGAGAATLTGDDRFKPQLWRLLDVVLGNAGRDEALAALLKEYTGGLVCGLPPAKYEAYVGGRTGKGKASSSGTGSQSKGKSKVKPGQGIGSQSKGTGSTGKGSQGGKSSAPSAPLATPRTRSPRERIGEVPPWRSAPSSAPRAPVHLVPRSRSPVSARPGAGRGPAPTSAYRLRSPVASRTGGGRGPASPEGARREGPAIQFSKGGDVKAHRLEFLRLYCEVPERWISRE